jgi:hypothetical protein
MRDIEPPRGFQTPDAMSQQTPVERLGGVSGQWRKVMSGAAVEGHRLRISWRVPSNWLDRRRELPARIHRWAPCS